MQNSLFRGLSLGIIAILISSCGSGPKPAPTSQEPAPPAEARVYDETSFIQEGLGPYDGDFTWGNANVYFVITDRFYNGNPANDRSYGRVPVDAGGKNIGTFHGGDLAGLTKKLQEDYFNDLGVTALWITAPYEQVHGWVGGADSGSFAHYAYHGYYAQDFSNIDANMGTFAEFETFVDTAHAKGIRVIMDVVMNHSGYNTITDMNRFGFGATTLPEDWLPEPGKWHSHHSFIDYNDAEAWSTWWGKDWIRAGIADYSRGGRDDLTKNLHSLPDFKTESTKPVALPVFLQNKETYRGERGVEKPVADWLIGWLTTWVREYGIDGFRADTARHVGQEVWAKLKVEAQAALEDWRAANPNKPGADWDEPFWAVAEVFGQGPSQNAYYTRGKFDSVINFDFKREAGNMFRSQDRVDQVFSRYARLLNGNDPFEVLNYISSHDTGAVFYEGDDQEQILAGSFLLLSPGGSQIFYGDEVGRENGPGGGDADQGSRSAFPWEKAGNAIHQHWQKVGQFRKANPAVALGTHSAIKPSGSEYVFGRSWTNPETGAVNNIVAVLFAQGETAVDVSRFFPEGSTVTNAYDGTTAVVTEGMVSFDAGANGTILLAL
jgi:alpha-amylase